MIKLLVIADDFTGAMDTGVQFKAKGTLIQIASEKCLETLKKTDCDLQVLIVDAETRHMTAQNAYQTVYQIVQAAVAAGFWITRKHWQRINGCVGCLRQKTTSLYPGLSPYQPYHCRWGALY